MINPLWGNGNIVNTYELSEDIALQKDQTEGAFVSIVFPYQHEEG